MHAPCPVCGDPYAGFHEDDCGVAVAVPRSLVLAKTVQEKVRLSDEEIAQRRADAAARRAERGE